MSFLSRDLCNLHNQMNSMFDWIDQNYGLNSPADMEVEQIFNPSSNLPGKDESALATSQQASQQGKGSQSLMRKGESEKMLSSFFPALPQSLLSMSMDVHASPESYNISCELPGVEKSSIDISADKRTNSLTIKAEKKHEFDQTEDLNNKGKGQGQAQEHKKSESSTQQGQGSKKEVQPQQAGKVGESNRPHIIRQERSYGMVQRTVRLAPDAELDRCEAQFDNGVLKLKVPRSKTAQTSAKKISIA